MLHNQYHASQKRTHSASSQRCKVQQNYDLEIQGNFPLLDLCDVLAQQNKRSKLEDKYMFWNRWIKIGGKEKEATQQFHLPTKGYMCTNHQIQKE